MTIPTKDNAQRNAEVLLHALSRRGGWASASDLARELGTDSHTIHLFLSYLHRRGLVERYEGGRSRARRVYRAAQTATA